VHETTPSDEPRRAVLVGVQLPDVAEADFAAALAELGRLARTLGMRVAGAPVTQRRDALDPGAVLGPGKREELARLVEETAANAVLVDHEISPSQARNLEKACGAEVMDRTMVILEIFRRHARSRAAKAQVEMVRLKYAAPRLREQGRGRGDRQRGGVGGKGAGESALELDRRKIRDRIAELAEELLAIEAERRTRRARRRDLSRVALVGYTNAGKSTLMRGLTGSDVLVEDKLFATLDTTVRALDPPATPRILVSDTVGFIEKLPHGLVDSFKSTLDEALEASLLVHVVDAAEPDFRRQMRVTEEVLAEIGAGAVPRLVAFNKIDKLDGEAERAAELRLHWPGALCLSAKRPDDVARLRRAIVDAFAAELVERELLIPYDKQARRAAIFEECAVLEERYTEEGVVFRVKAPRGFRWE
jgi:GTP-binding protein HflX